MFNWFKKKDIDKKIEESFDVGKVTAKFTLKDETTVSVDFTGDVIVQMQFNGWTITKYNSPVTALSCVKQYIKDFNDYGWFKKSTTILVRASEVVKIELDIQSYIITVDKP